MMNRIVLYTLTLILASAIYLPIKKSRPRCLSEYLLGSSISTVKIRIDFPKI